MIDLISRQAALDALTEYWKGISDRHPTLDGEMAVYADCKGIIKRLSSAQPERKKGRWVPGREIGKEILTDGTIVDDYEDYRCSSCGLIIYRLLHNNDGTPFYKFCPNCGADMRGEQDG